MLTGPMRNKSIFKQGTHHTFGIRLAFLSFFVNTLTESDSVWIKEHFKDFVIINGATNYY